MYAVTQTEQRSADNEITPIKDFIQFARKFTYSSPLGYVLKPQTQTNATKNRENLTAPDPISIRTVNFPMVIYWHRIKNMSEPSVYSEVFGQVYGDTLNDQNLLEYLHISTLLQVFLLNNFDEVKKQFLDKLKLTEDKLREIWSDALRGFGTSSGLKKWVKIYRFKQQKTKYNFELIKLAQAFDVNIDQVQTLAQSIFEHLDNATKTLSLKIGKSVEETTSFNLLKAIIPSQSLIKDLFARDSIKDEELFFFELEFDSFYKKYYVGHGDKYNEKSLDDTQTDLYYNVDDDKLEPRQTWSVLLHFTNLYEFRFQCKEFWKDNLEEKDSDLSYWEMALKVRDSQGTKYDKLELLKSRFQLKDNIQGEVLCGFIEHTVQSQLLLDKGGSFELYNLTRHFSESLTETLSKLEDLVELNFKNAFAKWVVEQKPDLDCQTLMKSSASISDDSINWVCQYYSHWEEPKIQFFSDVYNNCQSQYPTIPLFLSQDEILDLCTFSAADKTSYSTLISSFNSELKTIYRTESVNATDMAILQLMGSVLSNTPNPYIDASQNPVGLSVYQWESSGFDKPFEMSYFVDTFDLSQSLIDYLDPEHRKLLFNKNALLNHSVLYTSLVNAFSDEYKYFTKLLSLKDEHVDPLWKFVVLYVREYFLGGFYRTLTNVDIEKGVEVPYLREKKSKPILLGGDPTIENPMNPRLGVMELLARKHDGKDKYSKIDDVAVINNFKTVKTGKEIFNGNYTDTFYWNPWKKLIPIEGCEVFCPETKTEINFERNKMFETLDLEKSFRTKARATRTTSAEQVDPTRQISIYNYRFNSTLLFDFLSSRQTASDLTINKYIVNQAQFMPNSPDFYQEDLQGFLNVTSVMNAPFLISQNHLFNVDDRVYQKFEYLDRFNNPIFPDLERDGGFYETEQETSLVTGLRMNYHYHLELKPDLLFVGLEDDLQGLAIQDGVYFLAPMFNLEYSRQLDEKHFDGIFEGVFDYVRKSGKYYFVVLPVLFILLILLILVLYMFIKQRANDKREQENEDSLDSNQERLIGHENEHMDV